MQKEKIIDSRDINREVTISMNERELEALSFIMLRASQFESSWTSLKKESEYYDNLSKVMVLNSKICKAYFDNIGKDEI